MKDSLLSVGAIGVSEAVQQLPVDSTNDLIGTIIQVVIGIVTILKMIQKNKQKNKGE